MRARSAWARTSWPACLLHEAVAVFAPAEVFLECGGALPQAGRHGRRARGYCARAHLADLPGAPAAGGAGRGWGGAGPTCSMRLPERVEDVSARQRSGCRPGRPRLGRLGGLLFASLGVALVTRARALVLSSYAQHEYGNYVVQSALSATSGAVHAMLVRAASSSCASSSCLARTESMHACRACAVAQHARKGRLAVRAVVRV
jgi:hypothetical protein